MRRFSRFYGARAALFLCVLSVLLTLACRSGSGGNTTDPTGTDVAGIVPDEVSVSSPDFKNGEDIPARFTCDGDDISPQIDWGKTPDGTESMALIVDDPDAPGGIFSHWVIFNIPPDPQRLSRDIPDGDRLDNGALQGKNGFGDTGYGGPCPPSGPAHEYRFLIFALNASLALEPGASSEDVLAAMRGSVIGYGELSGMYAHQ